ncbi:MAG: hypothetical protein JSR59_07290 [Proteobacteria bacterium]|nr:hypothetical protein [Pseudomonadota bacterium]
MAASGTRVVTRLSLLMSIVGLVACDREPAYDRLFPLAAGHRWTYRVVTRLGDDAADEEMLTMRTLGSESFGATAAWHRRSDSGIDYWLRADASGIYRVASKSDLDAAPLPDQPVRYVLKTPYAVGTQWQATTAPYLLMRSNEFPREIRHSHPAVLMVYQIDATDAAIDTPYGHLAHCLRVRGTASVRLYADPVSGWRDLPLTTVEWYCPTVGLAKVERSEPARSAFLTGGTRTLELEAFE